jgi:MFS family permease
LKKLQPVVVFASLGHFYIHLCTAFYFVIVLALEQAWQLPYHELIGLWTLGSLLVGAAAVPAGMLSDRFGATKMMVVFFVGMGACSIAAGLSNSSTAMMLSLTGLGLFAGVYHPVGIPWLLRSVRRDVGKVLGFNGIFGSLGAAGAGLSGGLLIDLIDWRAAFIIPGAICLVTGLVLLVFVIKGSVADGVRASERSEKPSRGEMKRAFLILLLTMFLAGMVYQTTQISLPKVFDQRHGGLVRSGVLGVGLLVAGVYTAAGFMQIVGGYLADRFPLKPVYVGAMLVQIPMLFLAASLTGVPLVLIATVMVMANVGALPAENLLLLRYTPQHRHGLVFGLKFALAFGAAPVSVLLVSVVSERTGGSYWVFVILAIFTLLAFTAAAMLPGERRDAAVGSPTSA